MAGTIKHEWNGTVLTITSDSGTSSADLKGEKGDDGARGPQGKACSVATDTTHLGGVAAAEYALKTDLPQITAYNLLDNSYFPAAFVINQRGQTTYTGNKYTIDRWRAYHADTTHEITAAGIKVSGNTPNIYQAIEPHKIDTNKVYTAAAMDSEGKIYLRAAKPITTGYAGACLYISGSNYLFRLNGVKTWVWAALYEGEFTAETLPAYQYKGYAAELLECQRYYYKTTGQGYGYATNANAARLNIPLPIQMRVIPSIQDDEGIAPTSFTVHCGGTNSTATAYTIAEMIGNTIRLNLTSDGKYFKFTAIGGYASNPFGFSADL